MFLRRHGNILQIKKKSWNAAGEFDNAYLVDHRFFHYALDFMDIDSLSVQALSSLVRHFEKFSFSVHCGILIKGLTVS